MIRVLVVEDSISVRERLVEAIAAAPGFEVVGQASDGERAVQLCHTLRPDVVTMDMVLSSSSGVEATERIMAFCPTPILIVSASTNRRELFCTYDALAAGAVDVLEKPRGDEVDWEAELLSTLRVVSRIRVITHPRARLGSTGRPHGVQGLTGAPLTRRLVAVGGSTGGPGALSTVLSALPGNFPLPLLVVLHIGEPFGAALAEWLDTKTPLRVRCARDKEPLPPAGGQVVLAPPDWHMTLHRERLRLSQTPPRHSCRPSVDALFESVASEVGDAAVACLLTGMGKDGAQGLLAIRHQGGATLAQDEATSVVFGMPGEAVKLGAAREVLPLAQIGPRLLRLAQGGA